MAIVLALSGLLGVVIASIYRFTHRGTSYSQSFAQTLVLMGMVTALIMLIIGSNIARAFSLVGALSVIRFRNAVKETRDVGYMFLSMAIGMACGTRFYVLAIFATAALASVLVAMFKTDLFAKRVVERLLRVRLPAAVSVEESLDPVFRQLAADSRLVAIETVAGGALQEAVYTVVLARKTTPQAFLDAVLKVNGRNKAVLVIGQQEVDL